LSALAVGALAVGALAVGALAAEAASDARLIIAPAAEAVCHWYHHAMGEDRSPGHKARYRTGFSMGSGTLS
jgi:hypothetical protein